MKILIANPNTTQAVTDAVLAEARHHAAPGTDIIGATGRFGVGIVSTEAENTIAGHAALDLLANHAGQVDAAILAISFDTALTAAQELMPFPVLGMTASALHTACLIGPRFGLITFGSSSRSVLLDMVQRAGLTPRMVGCEAVVLASVAAFLDNSPLDQAVLAAIGRLQTQGASSVVIVGAATSGMARRLQPRATLPLLDGMACAIRLAEAVAGLGIRPAAVAPLAKPTPPQGLSTALAALLHPPIP
jgi:allantoin racemase